MIELPIDIEYLIFAWQDDSPTTQYYLDSETGSVILVRGDLDEVEDLKTEIESAPQRFLYIPKPNLEQLELDLADFIYTVADSHLKAMLLVAYEGPHKFASCKKILARVPSELSRWKNWIGANAQKQVKQWLKAHNLMVRDSPC